MNKISEEKYGFDINPEAVKITLENLNFECEGSYKQKVFVRDIRILNSIKDNSIDLIVTHPPYLNIIKYSDGKIEGDLSNIASVSKFLIELEKGIKELYRVLKEDKYCAISLETLEKEDTMCRCHTM